jgi:hypothetical protein
MDVCVQDILTYAQCTFIAPRSLSIWHYVTIHSIGGRMPVGQCRQITRFNRDLRKYFVVSLFILCTSCDFVSADYSFLQ